MNSEVDELWSAPQRQAPAGIFLIIIKAVARVLRLLWPVLLIVIFRGEKRESNTLDLILVVVPIVVLLNSILEFYYFYFFIKDEHLVIRRGFIRKKEISIALSRIHAVNIEQGFIERFLNIVKLKVDTAGTDSTEAAIDAISNDRAEQLKSLLLNSEKNFINAENKDQPAEQVVISGLTFRELLYLGISANHLQTFTIILAFAISFVQNLDEIFGSQVVTYVKESYYSVAGSIQLIATVVFTLFGVSILLSFFKIFLSYSNFRVTKTDRGLKVMSGLLEKRENIIPVSKIQFAGFSSTYLGRLIGLGYLRYYQAKTDEKGKSRRQRLPITNKRRLSELFEVYTDGFNANQAQPYHMNSIYILRKIIVLGLPLGILATLVFVSSLQWQSLFFLLIIPYVAVEAWIYRRNYRVYLYEQGLEIRSGVWGRKLQLLQWEKVQEVDVVQSFFQRRSGISNCVLRTAGGNISIRYIHQDLAKWIRDYSLFKVETEKGSGIRGHFMTIETDDEALRPYEP